MAHTQTNKLTLANPWIWVSIIVSCLLTTPILSILSTLTQPSWATWSHLLDTVFKDYVINSALLTLGVGSISLLIGVSTAWLTTVCQFPGKAYFQWLLLLPLAMPAYIIAFTYTGLLEPAGPIQTQWRDWFNLSYGDYWFPDIRSLAGAVIMLALVLYPYVYLTTRAALLEQSVYVMQMSRTLGNSPWRNFFTVALPLARPAIVVGLTLVCMETLADYGTVQYFGVNTFTTGIFRTWFGLNDLAAAAQLSSVLLLFVFLLIIIEQQTRLRQRFFNNGQACDQQKVHYVLTGKKSVMAFLLCSLPVVLGFVIPAIQLLRWAIQVVDHPLHQGILNLAYNSFSLGITTAIMAVILATSLVFISRHSTTLQVFIKVLSLGYAIPGAVIAVGVIILFTSTDTLLNTRLLVSSTLAILILAYLTRFLSISIKTVEAAFTKINPHIDQAARTLKMPLLSRLKSIQLPLLKRSVLTAGLLVFVEVLKELPATLILRPFDFNTLAVRAYELAENEQLMLAALPAISIVAVGLIPVILLSYAIVRPNHSHT